MKKILVLFILLLPVYVFASSNNAGAECNKFYSITKQGNNYIRYVAKIPDYPDEQPYEKIWHIDCKNNKVFFTGGIFEREYTLDKHTYDKKSKEYIINISGEEEGTLSNYTLKIKYIDDDKAYVYGYYQDRADDTNIYTISPNKYKLVKE